MEKSLLNTYVLNHLESLAQDISNYTQDQQPECLHRLRVAIKKIKAILHFAEKSNKEKYDATPLRPLFKKAGKIRAMQINRKLLNSIPQPPARLIAQLKKKEDVLIQLFIKNGARYLLLLKKFRKKIHLPKDLPNKKAISNYFKKENHKVKRIRQRKDRESMHLYRKRIKKIMYIYKALPKKIQRKIDLNINVINKQQKQLGMWHDTYSTLLLLSQEQFKMQHTQYVLTLQEKEKKQFDKLLVA